ncbi:MAG: TIGR03032 family protein, partial [Dongiaceae bacterium]
NAGPAAKGRKEPPLDISSSRQFSAWLNEQKVSIAFTTYQANMMFFIGLDPKGRLWHHRRGLPRCMGMTLHENSIYVSSLYQIWRFENALRPGQPHHGHDRMYVPKVGHVTGDIDVHDMAIDKSGRLIFVSSLYCCIATTSETHSFVPLWKPKFVSKLASEDRCHLNGLAMRDGRPVYATAISEGDVADGWRDHRRSGGILIDIQKNEVVARGFSMPHSPRWYRGRLWLHNSGTGEFGFYNFRDQKFQPVCFCPGYLRGLDFIGDYAICGLSQPRRERVFNGLELQERMEAKKAVPRAGVYVIDLRSGDTVHWVRFEGAVQELYDVALMRNCRRPMAIGFQTDEIRRAITIGGRQPGALQMINKGPRQAPDGEATPAADSEPADSAPADNAYAEEADAAS